MSQVERLGFQRGALLDALRGRHQNKAAVAYYLLLDSRRRNMGSGAYLRAELSSACEALMQNPLGESSWKQGIKRSTIRNNGLRRLPPLRAVLRLRGPHAELAG